MIPGGKQVTRWCVCVTVIFGSRSKIIFPSFCSFVRCQGWSLTKVRFSPFCVGVRGHNRHTTRVGYIKGLRSALVSTLCVLVWFFGGHPALVGWIGPLVRNGFISDRQKKVTVSENGAKKTVCI